MLIKFKPLDPTLEQSALFIHPSKDTDLLVFRWIPVWKDWVPYCDAARAMKEHEYVELVYIKSLYSGPQFDEDSRLIMRLIMKNQADGVDVSTDTYWLGRNFRTVTGCDLRDTIVRVKLAIKKISATTDQFDDWFLTNCPHLIA